MVLSEVLNECHLSCSERMENLPAPKLNMMTRVTSLISQHVETSVNRHQLSSLPDVRENTA